MRAFSVVFRAPFSRAFATFLSPDRCIDRVAVPTALMRSCSDTRSYQISIVGIAANSIIAVR